MKKINFKFKFKYNIKIAIFTTSALFFLYLLYLSIPSLYDTGRVQKVLSDKLLANFDLNISLSTDISYSMLPQPHFSIKDSKLFTVKSNVSNEFAEIKEVKISNAKLVFGSTLALETHRSLHAPSISIRKIEKGGHERQASFTNPTSASSAKQ